MVIIAAIDRSARARSVVATAAELAEAVDLPLHVVHVLSKSEFIELEESAMDRTGSVLDMDEIKTLASKFAADAANDIGVECMPVGLVGDASHEIVAYSKNQDARYIVVGPRRRSPTGKAIFGSTAQTILLQAPCPVMTVVDGED